MFQKETDLSSSEDEDNNTDSDSESPSTSSVLSPSTINKYFSAFRDIIGEKMLSSPYQMIGGPGTTVEIDESMFGKSKVFI